MSRKRHTEYMYNTNARGEKMLEIIMSILWACFAVYAIWYFTVAKNYAPITLGEAKILWKIHKRNIQCNARKWREVRREGKIVGFECECGYKHVQKRPITANTPALQVQSQTTIYNKIHGP